MAVAANTWPAICKHAFVRGLSSTCPLMPQTAAQLCEHVCGHWDGASLGVEIGSNRHALKCRYLLQVEAEYGPLYEKRKLGLTIWSPLVS